MEDLKDLRFISIREVDKLNSDGKLLVDRTYQRASNWQLKQQQFFIDSLLRQFPIPMIYLHHINGMYYIVDGQQRINSIMRFINNQITLLDPKTSHNIFPKYICEQETKWAGKRFNQLDNPTKSNIMNTLMPVAILEYEDHHIRDLFVRLQAGVPLTGQQKRDASVSGYNDFVLKLGGKDARSDNNFILKIKDGIEPYSGHDFFSQCVNNQTIDRGKLRQLVAQVAMLYFELIEEKRWIDIGDRYLDKYYTYNVLFDLEWDKSRDFENTLDILFEQIKQHDLKNHEVIHLVLFTKFMKELSQKNWEFELPNAFNKFRNNLENSNKTDDEYWIRYGQFIGVSAGSRKTIAKRHLFFIEQMLKFMFSENALQWKNIPTTHLNTDNKYVSSWMLEYIEAINLFINEENNYYLKIILVNYFTASQDNNQDNDHNNYAVRQTHSIRNIRAFLKDGSEYYGNTCNLLVPQIFSHLQGRANNNVKFIFGEISNHNGQFLEPSIDFWEIVQYVTFEMNGNNYEIYRDQVEDFCPERYV